MKNHRQALATLLMLGAVAAKAQLPDNVLDSECLFLAEGHNWSIVEDWHTTDVYCARIIPLVGDTDGDGVPEIIVFRSNGYFNTNEVYVVDSRTHEQVHAISLPRTMKVDHAAPYGLVKLPATASEGLAGHVIIVIATEGSLLYAFDLTARGTTPIWSASGTGFWAPTVAFSDFNCDGHPEVYIGNKIYDAETGALLVTAPGSNVGQAHGHANADFCVASFAADVMGDGKPDLILGNEVYSITLTNRSGTTGNSASLAARCTPPSGLPDDGHAQVADFNYDGYLDILITNKTESESDASCYVWDVHNNTVSEPIVEPQCYEGMSVPLIADVDNNGTVEIVWQTAYCPHSNPGNNMRAYKYDPQTRTFSEMWRMRIHDDSFSVPATLFDLNNDGYNDLIITDDDGIKIVNGSGKSHLTGRDTVSVYVESSFAIRANTTMQYAVVADVDGSGCAKIVALGKSGSYDGYLYVFQSADAPWMPARRVWNQYLYNVTCVNEDLTIPQHPYNNAMTMEDDLGNVRRPYNNCLQQATTIDTTGRSVYATPDIAIALGESEAIGDSVEIRVRYCNTGTTTLGAPYTITLLANHRGGPVVATLSEERLLQRDSCRVMRRRIANADLTALGAVDQIVVVVNGTAAGSAGYGAGRPECDSTNNMVAISVTPTVRSFIDSTVCADRLPLLWNDSLFTEAGTKERRLTAANGADSVVTLRLHVNPVYSGIADYDTIVQNQLPYSWNGTTFSTGGSQTATLESREGCDSVVTMHLHVWENAALSFDTAVCDNRFPLTWRGVEFSGGGTERIALHTQHGADSTIALTVVELDTYATTEEVSICEGGHYTFNGTDYSEDGSYAHTLAARNGCDSVATLSLTVRATYATTDRRDICANRRFSWGTPARVVWEATAAGTPGADQTQTRTETDRLQSVWGCDSTSTLQLTVHGVYLHEAWDTICFGERYRWGQWEGSLNSESDNHDRTKTLSETLTTRQHGCDSIEQLTLTQRAHPRIVFHPEAGCGYRLEIEVDVPWHILTAQPDDGSLAGNETALQLELNPQEETEYTLHADYSEQSTCPWSESLRLEPTEMKAAALKTVPSVLSADALECHLYDISGAGLRRTWYIDGQELADTAEHVAITADYLRDSVEVALRIYGTGCSDTVLRTLYIRHEEVYVPNIFTPGQDGNRRFRIEGAGLLDGELTIYNREGSLIYRTDDPLTGWDGSGAAAGVYVWRLRYASRWKPTAYKTLLGTVTLIR